MPSSRPTRQRTLVSTSTPSSSLKLSQSSRTRCRTPKRAWLRMNRAPATSQVVMVSARVIVVLSGVVGLRKHSSQTAGFRRLRSVGSRGVQTAERIEVTCARSGCGKTYLVRRKRHEAGRGRYCSPECRDTAPRSKRGKYTKHKDNPTSIKPGQHLSPGTEFQSGQDAWNKGVPSGRVPPNAFQPAPVITYSALHAELRRQRGPASAHDCAHADGTCKGPMNWANVSGEYQDLDDFLPLCQSHHVRLDRASGRWGTDARWPERRRAKIST